MTTPSRSSWIPGVSGIHVMAYRQEEYVAEIVNESGVLKGRQPWRREARSDEAAVAERLVELKKRETPYQPAAMLEKTR